MEIRECLSVYLESGYLFDDMSGRLKWFEIDKILISFTYGVVRYVGTWGGCRTEKTLDGKLFYSSEECFKKGESIPKTRLSIYDVFESLYGFIPIGDVWKYKNGRAVKDKLEYFDVEIDDKGKIYCKETYYRTREDVYKFNGLTVVDRNGDIRLVESSKSRLMLSNDQLDVVERMKGIIDDMVRLKMIMYIDQDYNLCFGISMMPNISRDLPKPLSNAGRQTNQELLCWMKKNLHIALIQLTSGIFKRCQRKLWRD